MTTKHIIIKKSDIKKSNKTIMQKLHDIKSSKHTVTRTKEQKKAVSDQWITRHLNDPFVQASKQDGFVSRAAYKLIEMNEKYKLFKNGDSIVDIGCAPGSWLQVIWSAIKSKDARLVGIDLLPLDLDAVGEFVEYFNKTVFVLEGDFLSNAIQDQVLVKLNDEKVDCIVSDMAPNTTGIKEVDHLKAMEMIRNVVQFSYKNLKKGGNFATKIFDGGETKSLIIELKTKFKKVTLYKPLASRAKSSEIYLVALNYC